MIHLTSAALGFLAFGIFTSVTLLSGYQVLFGIAIAWALYLSWKEKTLTLPKSAWWLLAFFAAALLSLLINFDIVPKPSKNFGRLKYFLFGVGGIFVLRLWSVSATEKAKRMLSNIFLASLIIAGLYATWMFKFSGSDRAKGLTDTMRYGYGSGMVLLVVLGAILHREKLRWFDWRLGAVAFVVGFTGMYLTFARGGLLGFLCGVPVLFTLYRPKLGVIFGGAAVLLLAVLGGFYLFGSYDQGTGNRYLINKGNSSDMVRRSQWKAAIIATQEKPVLGWGLSNFHTQLKRIKETHDLEAKAYNDAHSHNLFLEIASGTGLVGLFFFVGWVLSWAWEVFRGDPLTRALVLPFGVAFVVCSQFEVTFDANNASMIFFLYALSVAQTRQRS